MLTPKPLLDNLLALEESYVDEGTVKVEHFEHISPDSESVFILQLSFVVLPLRHLHSKLPVVLTREEGINFRDVLNSNCRSGDIQWMFSSNPTILYVFSHYFKENLYTLKLSLNGPYTQFEIVLIQILIN